MPTSSKVLSDGLVQSKLEKRLLRNLSACYVPVEDLYIALKPDVQREEPTLQGLLQDVNAVIGRFTIMRDLLHDEIRRTPS